MNSLDVINGASSSISVQSWVAIVSLLVSIAALVTTILIFIKKSKSDGIKEVEQRLNVSLKALDASFKNHEKQQRDDLNVLTNRVDSIKTDLTRIETLQTEHQKFIDSRIARRDDFIERMLKKKGKL